MNCGLQSYLKALKESKKSNVTVTMMYLGQGLPGSAPDEMKVLQQICGGENICVFKGLVRPGGTALDPLTTLYILFSTVRNWKIYHLYVKHHSSFKSKIYFP